MRTVRNSSHFGGGSAPRGICSLGEGSAPGRSASRGVVSQHALRQNPPVDRMTDMCKKLTFATSLRTVKVHFCFRSLWMNPYAVCTGTDDVTWSAALAIHAEVKQTKTRTREQTQIFRSSTQRYVCLSVQSRVCETMSLSMVVCVCLSVDQSVCICALTGQCVKLCHCPW